MVFFFSFFLITRSMIILEVVVMIRVLGIARWFLNFLDRVLEARIINLMFLLQWCLLCFVLFFSRSSELFYYTPANYFVLYFLFLYKLYNQEFQFAIFRWRCNLFIISSMFNWWRCKQRSKRYWVTYLVTNFYFLVPIY